ncbi:MAG: hypothetical protein ABR606_03490 [Vicinamibacterales bacterium]
MGERRVALQRVLTDVRRRWTARTWLRAVTVGALAAAMLLLAGWVAIRLIATDGLSLVLTLGFVVGCAAFALARAVWPLRRRPTDSQLARLIEERSGGLDDVVATAVAYGARPDASDRMSELLALDAVVALRGIDLETIASRKAVRQALVGATAALASLVAVVLLLAPSFTRAGHVGSAYLFPAHLEIEVMPGSAKHRAGQPLTIAVRLPGSDGAVVPTLTVGSGAQARSVDMQRDDQNGFAVTLKDVNASFAYSVAAARARSPEYAITVIRPPRVERIDLQFDYPKGLGLAARTEEDGGDIYGPAGTKVSVKVTADKPITQGSLALADGTTIPLNGQSQVLDAALTIEDDGSYRVALVDADGLENQGDTEYFIRTLLDRPPDVRILRPGGDRQVTPLEEVLVEARADDDFGIASLELVFQKPGGQERALKLPTPRGGLTANGARTLFLEDLGVQPGDFVTYFARARDVGRGRRGSEARSDIFFLEVKPFEEEFVAAQSQAMGMQGGSGSGLQELAEAQKEVIVATWKLDARSRRARDARSEQDIRAVSKAQAGVKTRAEQASGALANGPDPRRRRGGGARPGVSTTSDDPMGKAVEAMARAVDELDGLKTSPALPHEMEALNQLLKAEAEVRRRQVARQQQAGGGGGQNRSGPDLSTLFDQELRKRQETNYETPNTSETREEEKREEDPLEKIRELARRQAALNREQEELSRHREQLAEEELKRQLERLTREQNDLRQQAEQLARQLQSQPSSQSPTPSQQGQQGQQGQQANGQQGQGGRSAQTNGRQLREISEKMRDAASELRRQDPSEASARGSRALEQLRDLEQQMQGARPDDRKRALGDLQLETRQLADAERRLANEATRTSAGQAGQDARRRLAGEQERLADRVERLTGTARTLAQGSGGDRSERQAIEAAARELERQQLAERMRQSAKGLRDGSDSRGDAREAEGSSAERAAAPPREREQPGRDSDARPAIGEAEELAKALDRVADRLGATAGGESADARRLSDQLSRTQELRQRVAELERSISELQRQGSQDSAAQEQSADAQTPQQPGQQGQTSSSERGGEQPGQRGQSSQSQGSQPGSQGREGSSSQSGGTGGGRAGGNGEMQREIAQRMREAERMTEELRRDNPGTMLGSNTPEGWWPSISAPGTESFKQDFAKWESLKQNLLVALEQVETSVSGKLRDRENRERLNAGRHEAVPESYREQVDRYYRSLAAPRRAPQ